MRTISFGKFSTSLRNLIDKSIEAMDKFIVLPILLRHSPLLEREQEILQFIPHSGPVQLPHLQQQVISCRSDQVPRLVRRRSYIVTGGAAAVGMECRSDDR